jgi:hypothetical protein
MLVGYRLQVLPDWCAVSASTLDETQPTFVLAARGLAAVDCRFSNRTRTLNRVANGCLINVGATFFPQTLHRRSVLPQADRRAPQVPVGKIVVLPVRCEQVDPAQITRIVADDHLLRLSNPGSQNIGPVLDRM